MSEMATAIRLVTSGGLLIISGEPQTSRFPSALIAASKPTNPPMLKGAAITVAPGSAKGTLQSLVNGLGLLGTRQSGNGAVEGTGRGRFIRMPVLPLVELSRVARPVM